MSHHPYTGFADQVLRRVDAVLRGEGCRRAEEDGDRDMLILLRGHVGRHEAISRHQLSGLLGKSDREVRQIVHTLREEFGVAIGTCGRAGRSGYYLVSSAEEAREITGRLFRQAFSLLRVARVLGGRHATAEWFGQTRIQLDLDTEAKQAAPAAAVPDLAIEAFVAIVSDETLNETLRSAQQQTDGSGGRWLDPLQREIARRKEAA